MRHFLCVPQPLRASAFGFFLPSPALPNIGVLLCKTQDEDVVEYTLSRRLSPAMRDQKAGFARFLIGGQGGLGPRRFLPAFRRFQQGAAKRSPLNRFRPEYQTQLPDKAVLQAKLEEFYEMTVGEGVRDE